MNLLHMSDIHYRSFYSDGPSEYENMLSQMDAPMYFLQESLKQALSEQEIDVVLITGDLTEDGSVDDYRILKHQIQKLVGDRPVIITPGNHDNKKNLRIGWMGIAEAEAECAGDDPCYFIEVFDEAVIVSFDSSVQGCSDGCVDPDRLLWLEQELLAMKEKGKPVILMTHHQLIDQLPGVPPIPESEKIKEILRETRPTAVLCGHTHHHYVGRVAEVPYYIADSMSFRGESLEIGGVSFEEGYGYSVYHLGKNGIDQCKTQLNLTGRCLGEILFKKS